MDWIYKVCLPQHSDAPPSAFYPVNQFCCFVLFKELRLWKRMLSACRFSLLLHTVCRTDPGCDVAAGSACCITMYEVVSAITPNFFNFIMSSSSCPETWFLAWVLSFGFGWSGKKSQIWLVLIDWCFSQRLRKPDTAHRVLRVQCCYTPSSHHTFKGFIFWLLNASHSGLSNHDKSGLGTMAYSFAFSFVCSCLLHQDIRLGMLDASACFYLCTW